MLSMLLLLIRFGDAIDIAADLSAADQKKKNLENFLMFIYVGIVSGGCAWIYTSLFKVRTSFTQDSPVGILLDFHELSYS